MQIRKLLSKIFVCVISIFLSCSVVYAFNNLPTGEVGEYGNWLNSENIKQFNENITADFQNFEPKMDLDAKTFVPIEAKIGLMFMKALSSIDTVLQMSLVRFTIIFLLIMYVCWVALEAYKMVHDSTDYKTVVYNIFEKGLTIAVWIIILNYGIAKIFTTIISPILSLGAYLSDMILNNISETFNVEMPNTCAAIHNYVNKNTMGDILLIDNDAAANIMCLPSRISIFFYHAVSTGFTWVKTGLANSASMVCVGIVSIVIFIKCIFKYAFMTLGVVADLFLTLLLLPFTAIAESMPPASKDSNIPARVYNGFLTMFKFNKLSEVFNKFINATIYFVSLSIIIAICAAFLSTIISFKNLEFSIASGMTIILAGCLVLYMAAKTDEWAKNIGGSIDNSFGTKISGDVKNLWDKFKKLAVGGIKKVINK